MVGRNLARACITALLAAVTQAPESAARQGYAGAGLASFGGGGFGIARDGCSGSTSESGFALWAGYAVFGRALSLQGTVRSHRRGSAPACGIPERLPDDGTYLDLDHRKLLQYAFVATDLRARVSVPSGPLRPRGAVGVGRLWRDGADLPYLFAGGGVAAALPLGLLAGAEFAVYSVRVRFDRVRRTWEGFAVISEVPLGPAHQWNGTNSLTVFLEVPVAFD